MVHNLKVTRPTFVTEIYRCSLSSTKCICETVKWSENLIRNNRLSFATALDISLKIDINIF